MPTAGKPAVRELNEFTIKAAEKKSSKTVKSCDKIPLGKGKMQDIKTIFKEIERLATKQIIIEGYDLGRISGFLKYIGNPQDAYRIIHVGGTSGKGSTTAIITAILAGQGYKTAAYYSPHIINPMERIRINGKGISVSDFVAQYSFIREKLLKFFSADAALKLTYFEFLLAMAFNYFKEQKVDALVLEVGIGGKLDPTNIAKSEVAVVTNVGLDHTRILGNTVEKIAADKVQILKHGTTLVTGAKKQTVLNIMADYAGKQAAAMFVYGKDFATQTLSKSWQGYGFKYNSGEIMLNDLKINLPGEHQVVNAAVAITACRQFLQNSEKEMNAAKLRESLYNVAIPGRIQVVQEEPKIIFDTAHNGMKMRALVKTLNELVTPGQKIRLLLAFKKGQQVKRLLRPLFNLRPAPYTIVVTRFKVTQDIVQNSEASEQFLGYLERNLPDCSISYIPHPVEAYKAVSKDLKEDEILIVTGSFYLLNALFSGNALPFSADSILQI